MRSLYFGGDDFCRNDLRCRTGSLSNVLDGCLEQAKASTRRFLGIPVALQLVFGLQASPFIRIHGLEVVFLVLAIGGWLKREQRRVRPANYRLGISVVFRVPEGAGSKTHGRCLDFMYSRIEIVRPGIARTTSDRHRE